MTIDVKWFQDRIRDLGTSQRQVSAALASNPNTVSLVLSGKRKVTHEEIPALAHMLDTTAEEILKRLGVDGPMTTKANSVQVIGVVDETGRVTQGGVRSVEAPSNATANSRAIIFQTSSGDHPQHGWVYYLDLPAKPKAVDADSLNALCFVEVGDKEGFQLGVVRRGIDRGKFDLANAFTGERIVSGVTIRSALPVTWIKAA